MNANTTHDLTAIAALSVAALTAALDGLAAEQLADLYELEGQREGGARSTALAAIRAELEKAVGLGDEAADVALGIIDQADAGDDSAGGGDGGGTADGSGATPEPAPQARVQDDPESPAAAPPPAAPGPSSAAPAWQAPEYTGPLTGDQAQWRFRNLKPVTGVRTK